MFFRYLEHLRQKPAHVRNQYAFWFAFVVVVIVGILWALTLPQQFNFEAQNDADSEGVTPFAGMMERLRSPQPESRDVEGSEAQSTTSVEATPTASTSTSSPVTPSLILNEETLRAIASSSRATSSSVEVTPPGRMILIATTSAEAAAEPE